MSVAVPAKIGIERVGVYAGVASIGVETLLEGRGLDTTRSANLGMVERSVGMPFEDPVTNAVHAALPILEVMSPEERARIELLVVSTESGIDFSKSVSSYVQRLLGLSPHCRILEVKQACFAATGVLQLAVGLLASGLAGQAQALVIATDVALVDSHALYAEPSTGHGAVALLLSDRPDVLAIDLGAYGNYAFETLDSARPDPTFDIADPDRSLLAYLDCLEHSFADYCTRVPEARFDAFDYLALHTPFAGLVRAGHRAMLQADGHDAAAIQRDFEARVAPGLAYPARTGNLCSGSLYLALASLVENAALDGPVRVGLYSYGSGCCSEFFSGVVGEDAAAALAHSQIEAHLAQRAEISFSDYTALLPLGREVLTPAQDRKVDLDALDLVGDQVRSRGRHLLWTGTSGYEREYRWMRDGQLEEVS